MALKQLKLDEVWFMITPNSPFKDIRIYAPTDDRMHLAHLVVRESGLLGSKLKISEFEILLRHFDVGNATATMLQRFTLVHPTIQPVWLMGADNLTQLHTWGGRWQEIMELYPVVVFSREGYTAEATESVVAQKYRTSLCHVEQFDCHPNTWCIIRTEKTSVSSTKIRELLASGIKPEYLSEEAIEYIRIQNMYGYADALNQKFS